MPMQPSPMADTCGPSRPSSRVCIFCLLGCGLGLVGVGKHLTRDGQRGAGGRPAGIESEMSNDLDNLLALHAILQRLLKVEGQFILSVQRDQRRDRDEAAIAWA